MVDRQSVVSHISFEHHLLYSKPENRTRLATLMAPSPAPKRRLIGYARVSTEDQMTDAQLIELKAAGCLMIHQEQGSGASRARPVLAQLLKEIRAGDVLVVVRLDRLARSVSHLLEVIEGLEKKGAHFKSLQDPIDTSTPQGMFSLQVLGAVAQLERSLISERTKAGLRAAKARGKVLGNPGVREHRPETIRRLTLAREKRYLDPLIASADRWMPTVKRMRPRHSWTDVVRVLNGWGQDWTEERLRRAVRKLVSQRMADPVLLQNSPRRSSDDRLSMLIAGIAMADPDLSLREIAVQLERMRERTPRGGTKWNASSVKQQLDRARKAGMALPTSLEGVV
ncbi:site-specific recombinase, DNA invertase Pin [Microvirga lotononidis]|uniref:Site-specific recombinase, DNA invertase Pin n=2 Tax=Microvirga lotononidis TaxID=864069 RepID=I4Z4V4_9HYPH|nr:site-specific recombinase, DNA invertase Pin [Microvirga lotononidis]